MSDPKGLKKLNFSTKRLVILKILDMKLRLLLITNEYVKISSFAVLDSKFWIRSFGWKKMMIYPMIYTQISFETHSNSWKGEKLMQILFLSFLSAITSYPTQQTWKFRHIHCTFVISSNQSILSFESPRSLGRKVQFFSPLGFDMKRDSDGKTSKIKFHLFRALKQYLSKKNWIHGRKIATILIFRTQNIGWLTRSDFRIRYLLKFKEVTDANQHFYELKQCHRWHKNQYIKIQSFVEIVQLNESGHWTC